VNVIAPALPAIAEAFKLAAEFAPEIEVALEALVLHKVDREAFNAAVRDLIVKQGEARMRAAFPGQEP